MFKTFATATAIALTATALTAAPALAQTVDEAKLVANVQSEAAWHGVEVSRIQRTGNRLVVFGADRQERDVRLVMTCKELALNCRTKSMMASVPGKTKAPAAVSGMSVTSGK